MLVHRKLFLLAFGMTLFVTSLSAQASQQGLDKQLLQHLRSEDERLLNAVHRGDRAAWESVTTPDFMYVEDGDISRRVDFLKGLEEDGLKPLVILTYEGHREGDTVTIMHIDGLSARPNVDTSRSHFLFLETWQQIAGEWKLRLIHIDRLRVDPNPVVLTPLQQKRLEGEYTSGDARYVIRVEGNHLVGFRTGGSPERLQAETPDVLFISGNNQLRKIFRFDQTGRVLEFVDRNVAIDRVWLRTSPRGSN